MRMIVVLGLWSYLLVLFPLVSLFIDHSTTTLILLLVYIDDVVITSNDSKFIFNIITQLNKKFSLKDLGNLHYFVGIEVKRFSHHLLLTQTKYAKDLLEKAHMLHATKISTPIAHKQIPLLDDTHFTDLTIYKQLCGSFQYSTCSWPDLTHSINLVCQHF